MQEEWFAKELINILPAGQRDLAKMALKATNPLGDKIADQIQAAVNQRVKDLKKAGLVPKQMEGIIDSAQKLGNKMFDDVQAKTNKDIKDMAQIVEEEEDDE